MGKLARATQLKKANQNVQFRLAENAYKCAIEAEENGLPLVGYMFRVSLSCICEDMSEDKKSAFLIALRNKCLTDGPFEKIPDRSEKF
jgi:hypothetical protein